MKIHALLPFCLFACLSIAASAQSVTFGGGQTFVCGGFYLPVGVAVDGNGNVFVADLSSVYGESSGTVTEIPAANSGNPAAPYIGSFWMPHGVAVDRSGDVFVATTQFFGWQFPENPVVEELLAVDGSIPADPAIKLLVNGLSGGGVAVDASGNVFVADTSEQVVKEILAVNGSIPAKPTTRIVAGGFEFASGVAVDSKGDVFVADPARSGWEPVVEEIVAVNGSIPASNPEIRSLGGGFSAPTGVAVDASGNVFVADLGLGAVEEMVAVNGSIPASNPTIRVLGSGLAGDEWVSSPYGVAVDAKDNLFVTNTSGGSVAEDDGTNSVVELQPDSVDFGKANVCAPVENALGPCSASITLNFNVAAGTTIGGVNILTGGVANLDFRAETNDNSTILCSAKTYSSATTCTVDVTFAPLAPGQRNGEVQILDGSGDVLAAASIFGNGGTSAGSGQLSVPSLIDVPAVPVGENETVPVTVENIGTGPLTFTASIVGPNYAVLTNADTENTCTGQLGAGQSCILPVAFHPPGVGLHTAPLIFSATAGSPVTTTLRGEATGVGDASESSLDFGSVPEGGSEVFAVTIENFGVSGSPTFTATLNNENYSLATGATCGEQGLASGQQCTLMVQFAPVALGVHNAGLTITPSAGPSTIVKLLGMAIEP